jgi:hypothetical protein
MSANRRLILKIGAVLKNIIYYHVYADWDLLFNIEDMTQYFPTTLPGNPAGKVFHNQVHGLVKRLVPLGELKVVRNSLFTGSGSLERRSHC